MSNGKRAEKGPDSTAHLGFEAKLSLAADTAMRGTKADFGPEHAHTFRHDLHPDFARDLFLPTFAHALRQ